MQSPLAVPRTDGDVLPDEGCAPPEPHPLNGQDNVEQSERRSDSFEQKLDQSPFPVGPADVPLPLPQQSWANQHDLMDPPWSFTDAPISQVDPNSQTHHHAHERSSESDRYSGRQQRSKKCHHYSGSRCPFSPNSPREDHAININGPSVDGAPPNNGPSFGESMQMLMMNQMMMQQMSAQQMQAAQMSALLQKGSSSSRLKHAKPRKPAVRIKSRQVRRPRGAAVVPVAVPPQPVTLYSGSGHPAIETAAIANWQEITIILCIALVGLIYLVSSRASKTNGDDKSAAARHITTKAK